MRLQSVAAGRCVDPLGSGPRADLASSPQPLHGSSLLASARSAGPSRTQPQHSGRPWSSSRPRSSGLPRRAPGNGAWSGGRWPKRVAPPQLRRASGVRPGRRSRTCRLHESNSCALSSAVLCAEQVFAHQCAGACRTAAARGARLARLPDQSHQQPGSVTQSGQAARPYPDRRARARPTPRSPRCAQLQSDGHGGTDLILIMCEGPPLEPAKSVTGA